MKVTIIGAGIGGLTLAIALKKKGIAVEVFEQAEVIKPVGAGIILANNAMQVYEKLGLKKEIEAAGNPISSMMITNSALKVLSHIDLKYFERKFNARNIAIHRGKLQQILANKLGANEVFLNHQLTNISESEEEVVCDFNESKSVESTVVVGADGLNSKVRSLIFPDYKIRHTNQVCWRGVTDYALPGNFRSELNEMWGKGDRFGFVNISKGKVYWYAIKNFNPIMHASTDLLSIFKNYHPLIPEIIQSTPEGSIHYSTISDLKPTNRWHTENICLMGDAAHATTPNMGQGACQAIEDAYVLSEFLNKLSPVDAFQEFQKLRLPKAHDIVKKSWILGKIAHLSNPVGVMFRNQLIKLLPASVSSSEIYQLNRL